MSITEADIIKIIAKIDTALATIAKLSVKLAAVTAERDALAEELQHYREQGLITPREPQ